MQLLKQSSTAQPLLFQLIDSSDHIAGKTGATPTVTIRKPGGSFASPAGAVTEIANGWYQVAGNATDTGTLGPLVLHATASGADPVDVVFQVVAFDPQSATSLGLSTLAGNVPQTGDTYAALPVRFSLLGISSGGAINSVLNVNGDIFGDVKGKVVGSGISDILGAGAWVMNDAGAAVATASAATAIKAKTDQMAFTVANQVDSNVIVKTGFALGATGLDAIPTTAPTGVAATFREMIVALWRRTFKKTTLTATQLKTYADDGTTVLSTQAVSDDSTTQTQGNAS